MFLSASYPKCFKFQAPLKNEITIKYDCPDVSSNPFAITINQEFEERNTRQQQRGRPEIPISQKLSQDLREIKGSLTFVTSDNSFGPVLVCAQSPTATSKVPVRYSLKISMKEYEDPKAKEQMIKHHVSRMENDLKSLERKVSRIRDFSDQNQEEGFKSYDSARAMNRKTKYWPLFHIVVLLITTVYQAKYVIKFFEKRHLV